ncbi:MAG: glycosyltransferase [Candidatus Abyssobacteria bacterium SURF_5]|uniref:Glycosyltransferase n=1 Tax=Abyssobacteria bacterium (strain SURF_5) TaxID=2093360 RepID=A0A3A4N430_ABYX5|nr:MAG: glycosyltransferase [Candidatus Abyssubacteria bacterium SURF_5]
MDKQKLASRFDTLAPERDSWKSKNRYYYAELERICSCMIPPRKSVLEIGCGTGDILNSVRPQRGVGIDLSNGMLEVARRKYPHLEFRQGDAEALHIDEKFDYVILSDLIGFLSDIWQAFTELKKVCRADTSVVVTQYNYFWEPVLKFGEKAGLKMPQQHQNWLAFQDLKNLLHLTGFEVVREEFHLLVPKKIPALSTLANEFLVKIPGLHHFCLLEVLEIRPLAIPRARRDYSCSIIIPTRNEAGNIEGCVERTPQMGSMTELVFVDGESTDGTVEKIKEMIARYEGRRRIKLLQQKPAVGKADAMRIGFDAAEGDIFMILDSDLTVPPEDLPKFYIPLAEGTADFVNGSRLVYPMEKEAMRLLNVIANKLFSYAFTWLLEQRITDTLCGTKVFFKKDYKRIEDNRSYFGDFDPFGDFDLLFGASRLGLRMVEIPIRYRARTYGDIKIERFKHGWLLLKMTAVAFRKLKLSKWRESASNFVRELRNERGGAR